MVKTILLIFRVLEGAKIGTLLNRRTNMTYIDTLGQSGESSIAKLSTAKQNDLLNQGS